MVRLYIWSVVVRSMLYDNAKDADDDDRNKVPRLAQNDETEPKKIKRNVF